MFAYVIYSLLPVHLFIFSTLIKSSWEPLQNQYKTKSQYMSYQIHIGTLTKMLVPYFLYVEVEKSLFIFPLGLSLGKVSFPCHFPLSLPPPFHPSPSPLSLSSLPFALPFLVTSYLPSLLRFSYPFSFYSSV